jgi:hypothetical protein
MEERILGKTATRVSRFVGVSADGPAGAALEDGDLPNEMLRKARDIFEEQFGVEVTR